MIYKICSGGFLSGGFLAWGFCPGGFCRGEVMSGGFCPDTIYVLFIPYCKTYVYKNIIGLLTPGGCPYCTAF